MDRFEIAVHFKNQRKQIKAFHFPATRYAGQAEKYIEYCIDNEGIYIADNVPENALEKALVNISEIYEAPIIVELESKAQIFTISHSYKAYSLEYLPKRKYALCYNCPGEKLPNDFNLVGTIYSSRKPFIFS